MPLLRIIGVAVFVLASWVIGPNATSAFNISLDQQLPISGMFEHYLHGVNPNSSARIEAEDGPYLRVRVRLAHGVDVGDWNIEILNDQGVLVEKIPSRALQNGVWTDLVWGLALYVKVPPQGGRVVIEGRLRIMNPLPVQNVIPRGTDPNFTSIDSHLDPQVRKAGRTVVNIRAMHGRREKPCTGFFLSPDLVMTNEHCIPNAQVAKSASFFVEDRAPNTPPIEILHGRDLLVKDYTLDYSVIRLKKPSTTSVKAVVWRTSGPKANEPIAVVQHPNGQPLQVADDKDCYISAERAKGRDCGKLVDFGHRCDTQDGSSGSLVLGLQDMRVVGIHHYGIREGDELEQNQAVRIDYILKDLQQKAINNPNAKEIYETVTKQY